jgi:hypothetical protein
MGIDETAESTMVALLAMESQDTMANILLSTLFTKGEKSSTLGFVVPIGRPK